MVIVFTDRRQARRPLPEIVAACVEGGARLVVLREKDLPDGERAALVAELRTVLGGECDRLLVAGRDHLAAADRWRPGAAGRSCHDAAELTAAAAEGARFATLSPVFVTRSKPGYGPPLGLARFAELCAGATLPVYALGGIETGAQATACRAAGAAGVAVMGAAMRADDPAALLRELA